MLPPPRYLGNAIYYNHVSTVPSKSNYFAIMFGQFKAHDLGERAYYQIGKTFYSNDFVERERVIAFVQIIKKTDAGGPDFQACTADNSAILPADEMAFGSVPIEIPANDPYLSKYNIGCLDFVRSNPSYRNDCKFSSGEFVRQFYICFC